MLKYGGQSDRQTDVVQRRLMNDAADSDGSEVQIENRALPKPVNWNKQELLVSGGKMMNTVNEFSGEFNQREKMQKQYPYHH